MSTATVSLPEGFTRRSRAAVEAAMRLCDEADRLRREVGRLDHAIEVIVDDDADFAVYDVARGTDYDVLDALLLHARWLLQLGNPSMEQPLWADQADYLLDRFGWSAPLPAGTHYLAHYLDG